VTWWKRAEPVQDPQPTAAELRRIVAELQNDTTVLFDLFTRIDNRLKQRESRAAKRESDDSGDRVDRHDLPDVRRADSETMGISPSSSSLAASISPPAPQLTKEQVRELWRERQGRRA
jgi:hypothetical protein